MAVLTDLLIVREASRFLVRWRRACGYGLRADEKNESDAAAVWVG
jgi:hypothetical protein